MSAIPVAEHQRTTYENFVAECPWCRTENIFNRASDLETFEPIAGRDVSCQGADCGRLFRILGDSVILDEISSEHRGRRFAIIIDEAHSSQCGRTSAKMSISLSEAGAEPDEEEELEDKINRLIEAKKLLPNASYFAFTSTPKNKTLEIFGDAGAAAGRHGETPPFHSYTMKQDDTELFSDSSVTTNLSGAG